MSTKEFFLFLGIALVSGCGGAKDAAVSASAPNQSSELTLTPAQQSRILIEEMGEETPIAW